MESTDPFEIPTSSQWVDVNLRWNSSEYGGVADLRIPPWRIWKPDVLMYNSADEKFDGTYHTNVVVRNNGSCTYIPPGIFKSTCKIDITWFPFDDQRCKMKFGSWTYDGNHIDLQLSSVKGGDLSTYITNGEWELIGEPFIFVEFTGRYPYFGNKFLCHFSPKSFVLNK
ncbi:neuronal acetylcholine receptor subunit alpha-7 [Caerostris darwini]|uniref:Neuronal acetylcholine receptor subunit alpha-7 n=1 Tax=Caerostris darwini TaxID=1538125 RepID=A0AAV4Q2U9_9ARAC|nr:neuronal acetylcholine receptor subunit alpha-7 [Caerostris darwini]